MGDFVEWVNALGKKEFIVTGSTALQIVNTGTLKSIKSRDLDFIVPVGFVMPAHYQAGNQFMIVSKTLGIIEVKNFSTPQGFSVDVCFTDLNVFWKLWNDTEKTTIVEGVHVVTLEFLVESYIFMAESVSPLQSIKARFRLLHIAIMLTCETRSNNSWFWNSKASRILPILESLKDFRNRLAMLELGERNCDLLSEKVIEFQKIHEDQQAKIATLEKELEELRMVASKVTDWKERYEKATSQLAQFNQQQSKKAKRGNQVDETNDIIESMKITTARYEQDIKNLQSNLIGNADTIFKLRQSHSWICSKNNALVQERNTMSALLFAHNRAADAMGEHQDMLPYLLQEIDTEGKISERKLCSTSLCRLISISSGTMTIDGSSAILSFFNPNNGTWIIEPDMDSQQFYVFAVEKYDYDTVIVYNATIPCEKIEDRPVLFASLSIKNDGTCKKLGATAYSKKVSSTLNCISWGASLLFNENFDVGLCSNQLNALPSK